MLLQDGPLRDESGRKPARIDLLLWAQVVVVPSATPEGQSALQLRGWGGLITRPPLKRRTSSPFFGKSNCSLLTPSTFSISTTEFYILGRIFLKDSGVGFPGGPVAKNLAANAGDTGLIPGLGGSHTSHSN